MTTQLLAGLNEAQREAVEYIKGPLLIIAGPGSGKTRVITHRIAYLVRTVGLSPHRILAMTFTNKAAKEMQTRTEHLVGTGAQYLTAGTFHSFCASVLRRHGQHVGLEPGFSIFDDDDQMQLMKAAMEEAEVDPKQFPRRPLHSVISKAKSVLMGPQALSLRSGSYFEEVAARVYHRYEELLGLNNAVDFDDLLMKTVHLLRDTPEVLQRYQERYLHLMVDEFQDTNVAQYSLSKMLAGGYRNICVVGDPDQSIYSWRSADIRNILNFQKDYSDAKVVTLEVNYRSTGAIIDAAKGIIAANSQRLSKEITPFRGDGERLVVHEAFDEMDEAQFVVRQIARLVRAQGVNRSQCAVMYRVNAQSRALEEACLYHGMPYRVVGGMKFYQREEVKDVIAYLRIISNPDDEVSLLRVINKPRRGIGKQSLDRLAYLGRSSGVPLYMILEQVHTESTKSLPSSYNLAPRLTQAVAGFMSLMLGLKEEKNKLDLPELIDALLKRSGFRDYLESSSDNWEDRWENILELHSAVGEYSDLGPGEGLAAFLQQLALVADVDSYDETVDAITLITLHQAKGLEFPVVFITGMEEGLLPHSRSMDDPSELEEERRLCYVGITRCMDQLFLTRAFRRRSRYMGGPTIASRFLQEVPAHLIKSADPFGRTPTIANAGKASVAVKKEKTLLVFKTGDRVSHGVFGKGLVISTDGEGPDSEVTVAFSDGAGIKRLLVSYAPLEKIES